MLVALLGGCSEPAPPAYDGTVIVGDGYVQVLATAPGDHACPPRIHRAGTCVRTPTGPGTCADEPLCVTGLEVRDQAGAEVARADGAYVETAALAGTVTVAITGCGGELDTALTLPPAPEAFSAATASPSSGAIEFAWQPAGGADQVCALWSWPGYRELCCAGDTGRATFALPDGVTPDSARLSRGVLATRVTTAGGAVEYYRTAETGELVP